MSNLILVTVWGLPKELPQDSLVQIASNLHCVLNDSLLDVEPDERMIKIVFPAEREFALDGLVCIKVDGFNYKRAAQWFSASMTDIVEGIKKMVNGMENTVSCNYVECRISLPGYPDMTIGSLSTRAGEPARQ
jgi:hypothetical protein